MDIHLRRFSNGLEHPHAQKHVIPVCNLLPELGQTSISIEISEKTSFFVLITFRRLDWVL
ncbi:hypothetical protein BDQ17DRAFT_888799 [Cyathus striatus]|nr:hypothetical protein BDQ17DRAFT_888799 [Cyathus striatus]